MGSPNMLMIGRLRKEMKRLGINPRQLSDMANVGRSFVYDILSGKSSNPTTGKISAIAEVLGVSVPYLICKGNEITEASGNNVAEVMTASIVTDEGGVFQLASQPDDKPYFFRQDWLEKELEVEPQNLRVLFIQGDSMYPALHNEDMVLVDISQKLPNPPGIFVLFDGVGIITKRLEYMRNKTTLKILAKSDNPKYTSYECNASELDILGKVVWFSRVTF